MWCSVYSPCPAQSGQDITPGLVISGKDFYGQPFDDPKLRASLVVSAAPNDPLAAAGGSTVADSVTGEAEFGNLFFIAKPGSTQKVTFSVLEPTQIEPLEMYVRMRSCYMGEVEPEGQNECVECPPGKYSWDPTSSQCLDCPINALCQGGASMWPLSGYWRSSNTSIEFHKCPLAEACLGAPISNDVLFKPNGDVRRRRCGCVCVCVFVCLRACVGCTAHTLRFRGAAVTSATARFP